MLDSPRNISILFLFLLLVVSSALYYPQYFKEKAKRDAMAAQLGALLQVASTTEQSVDSNESSDAAAPQEESVQRKAELPPRTKSENCVVSNNSPDIACTPGAIFEEATLEEICTPGYTKTARHVTTKTRKEVYAEYNIEYPQPRGSYEVDHLIPLAIGGSNDMANLFPQPAEPAPGFKEKDLVEVYLEEKVCAGEVQLGIAQERIAENWLAIYRNLSPEEIARLKAKYRNWSN